MNISYSNEAQNAIHINEFKRIKLIGGVIFSVPMFLLFSSCLILTNSEHQPPFPVYMWAFVMLVVSAIEGYIVTGRSLTVDNKKCNIIIFISSVIWNTINYIFLVLAVIMVLIQRFGWDLIFVSSNKILTEFLHQQADKLAIGFFVSLFLFCLPGTACVCYLMRRRWRKKNIDSDG
jgi:hypothetical protein